MKKLTVIESKYNYAAWCIHTDVDRTKVESSIKTFEDRHDAEIFRTCGVYGKCGVPYEIRQIDHKKYAGEPPHISIVRCYSDEAYRAVSQGNGVLFTGGYCVYAPAIVGGIQRAIGVDKRIGVVWIDAHSDDFIVETTNRPTLTLVGIPMSTLTGQTAEKWRKEACRLEEPVRGCDILAGDVRMDTEEMVENRSKAGVIALGPDQFADEEAWSHAVSDLADRVDAIYLQVDMDILDHHYIPNYFYDFIPGGQDMKTVQRNVGLVMTTGKVKAFSVFCGNFGKDPEGQEINQLNQMKIMGYGLSAWK
jgi:arginase family enzyme